MDSDYFNNVSDDNRSIYNCIINGRFEKNNKKRSAFTTLDMFPTILSSIGFDIKGEQLGLGVNLFSDRKTLAERYGLEQLNTELAGYTKFYKRFYK